MNCTTTSGFYYDQPASQDRWSTGGYAKTAVVQTDSHSIQQVSFANQAAFPSQARELGYARAGVKLDLAASTDAPAGTAVTIAFIMPWTIQGESSARADSPAVPSSATGSAAAVLTAGWENTTSGGSYIAGTNDWTALGAIANVNGTGSHAPPSTTETGTGTAGGISGIQVTMFVGESYFIFEKISATDQSTTSGLSAAQASTALTFSIPNVSMTIQTPGYGWTSCPV